MPRSVAVVPPFSSDGQQRARYPVEHVDSGCVRVDLGEDAHAGIVDDVDHVLHGFGRAENQWSPCPIRW